MDYSNVHHLCGLHSTILLHSMKTVLIIEPDSVFKENLIELVELEGYLATSAGTSIEAEIALHNLKPDIIICDLSSGSDEFVQVKKRSERGSENFIGTYT
jgi:DNA-binding NtrC family response regulator